MQLKLLGPDLPPDILRVVSTAVKAVFSLPENIKNPVIRAYINAIDRVFIPGIAVSALAGLAALPIKRDKISLQRTL